MAKVLVAEDEQPIRIVLADTLLDAGYEVIEATNGGIAFEKACLEHPDIILLDVMMPVMDGFEVLKKLRETPSTQSIPVVLLTAVPAAKGERTGRQFGVQHYITKPWTPDTLELTLRVALRSAKRGSRDEIDDSLAQQHETSDGVTPDGQELQEGESSQQGPISGTEKGHGEGPPGSLVLVEGTASAGKNLLCQDLTYGALLNGLCAAYFTSEYTANSFASRMNSIGLYVPNYIRENKLNVFSRQEPDRAENAGGALAGLARDIENVAANYGFIVVDAINNLGVYSQQQDILSFFSSCRRICDQGKIMVVAAHSYAFDSMRFYQLGKLCDSYLRLRTERIGSRSTSMIQIVKANNVELNQDNLVSVEVEPGVGTRIVNTFFRARV